MTHTRPIGALCGLFLLLLNPAIPVEGGDQASLFKPVPDASMREMSTDRPDTTESPHTVDAGHFQLEMSFFDYSRSGNNEASSFGLVNFKAGLLPDTDLQFVFDVWTQERTDEQFSGFSDVTLRLKKNLWGNDGGRTALALMPYVKIPTGAGLSNGEWEGGLIVPLGISLCDRLSLGLMAELDLVHEEDGGGHNLEWLHSATLGISLTDQLGMYVELVGIAGGQTDYQALFDAGITFAITDNLVLDAGLRAGLNDSAEDFGYFTGMSFRF